MALTPLRGWARALKQQALTVWFAARDARTPWAVRLFALAVAAYALSPIDLIPDFIPVLGLLDDLVIVPLGVWLVLRWLPADVVHDAREQARITAARPVSRAMAVVIVGVWLLAALLIGAWAWRTWGP